MNLSSDRAYRFGPFLLDPAKRLLTRGGEPVPLTPKVFDLLVALIRNGGRLLGKEELMDAVWPDHSVGEANLTQTVAVLRRALGGDPQAFIKTVPKRGYVFAAEVEELRGAAADRPPLSRSLAVLPFRAPSRGREQDYLGVGVADSIITRLCARSEVVVRPTSAVLGFHGEAQDPLLAGRMLGVEFVLTGALKIEDRRLRVSAQLLGVGQGIVLWAESFVLTCSGVFSAENLIAERVTEAVLPAMAGRRPRRRAKFYTRDTDAYREYLKGRYYLGRRTAEGFRKSAEHFRQAVSIDPEYALAYTGLADALAIPATYVLTSPHETVPRAKEAAARALELDASLPEAHAALGYIATQYDWDWAAAEAGLGRASEQSPYNPQTRHWRALYLAARGRLQEAIAECLFALELDPLSLIVNTNLGWIYHWARDYDRAVGQFRKALELDPFFYRAYWNLCRTYAVTGRHDEAMAAWERLSSLTENVHKVALLGYLRALGGDGAGAAKALAELDTISRSAYVGPYFVAEVYVGLGDTERAHAWLERACDERNWFMIFAGREPIFDPLRDDCGFASLLGRAGLA